MTREKLMLIAASAGIALGIGTKLADNQENALNWIGSLAAPWILIAFGIGALSANRRNAGLAATSTILIGVGVYYLWMLVLEGGVNLSYFRSLTMFWLLIAPFAGVVFGLAGWFWRYAEAHYLVRVTAVALAGGVIAGESVFMALTAVRLTSSEVTMLTTWITAGVMMPLALLRGKRDRLVGLMLTMGSLLIGFVMIPVFRWILSGGQPGPG